MSLPPNIEKFDRISAKTFALLYESFPVPRDLLVAPDYGVPHIQEIVDSIGIDSENFASEREEIEFIYATIRWLESAGYLDYGKELQLFGFRNAVLTAKGLEILKAIPPSISTDTAGKTLGELVEDAVKSGAQESISNAVKGVLSKGAEMLVPIVKVIGQTVSDM